MFPPRFLAEALKSSYSDQAASLLGPIIELGSRGSSCFQPTFCASFLEGLQGGILAANVAEQLPPDSSKQCLKEH